MHVFFKCFNSLIKYPKMVKSGVKLMLLTFLFNPKNPKYYHHNIKSISEWKGIHLSFVSHSFSKSVVYIYLISNLISVQQVHMVSSYLLANTNLTHCHYSISFSLYGFIPPTLLVSRPREIEGSCMSELKYLSVYLSLSLGQVLLPLSFLHCVVHEGFSVHFSSFISTFFEALLSC